MKKKAKQVDGVKWIGLRRHDSNYIRVWTSRWAYGDSFEVMHVDKVQALRDAMQLVGIWVLWFHPETESHDDADVLLPSEQLPVE